MTVGPAPNRSSYDGAAPPLPTAVDGRSHGVEPPILRCTGIGVTFSGLQALRDVDVTLARGEIVGLIGPNGSGKTTLLNVMSGVIAPTAGRVEVAGRDVTRWPAHRVAALGVARTFQNIRLFGELSVLENVEVGSRTPPGASRRARLSGARRARSWSRRGSRSSPAGGRAPCRMGSAAASRSLERSRRAQRSSCSTNLPLGQTRPSRTSSAR